MCVLAGVCACVCVLAGVCACVCVYVCVRVSFVCSFTLGSESPFAHFLSPHTDLNISVDVLVAACVYCSDSLFMYGKSLYICYKSIWNH